MSGESARVSEPTDTQPTEWDWADFRSAAGRDPDDQERHVREVDEAYGRGLIDGEEAGARVARDELQTAVSATVGALEEIRENRDVWDARLEEHLVVLAAAMAQKVIERVREEDHDVFVELARKAVAAFPVEESLKIRLHPADRMVLNDGQLLEQVAGDRTVRWIPDDDVVAGGCIVEGPDKIIDGRVDEALRRVVSALTDG